jgi:sigma-B regulation protein RsbU (phosphoserine phosphatase)
MFVQMKGLMPANKDDNIFRKETEVIKKVDIIQNSNIYDFDELMNEYSALGSEYQKLLKQTKKLVSISDRTQKELFSTREELQKQYDYINAELNRASDHVKSLLPSPFSENFISIDWIYKPSSKLGGDIFGYQFADNKHLLIYIIDVCGHGIGPALHSVSVYNTIRFQSLPRTDFTNPSEVVASLNNTFSMFDHNHLYFTMWCCVINLETRILKYTGAGHPPIIFVSKDNEIKEVFSKNPPVGTASDLLFSIDECSLENIKNIYLYTDGVYEIKDQTGKYMNIDVFKQYLLDRQKLEVSSLDDVLEFSISYSYNNMLEDDFTLLEINILK